MCLALDNQLHAPDVKLSLSFIYHIYAKNARIINLKLMKIMIETLETESGAFFEKYSFN